MLNHAANTSCKAALANSGRYRSASQSPCQLLKAGWGLRSCLKPKRRRILAVSQLSLRGRTSPSYGTWSATCPIPPQNQMRERMSTTRRAAQAGCPTARTMAQPQLNPTPRRKSPTFLQRVVLAAQALLDPEISWPPPEGCGVRV